MVKHVILWKLDEKLTDSEKDQVKAGIKEGLEDITVRTEGLPSSNVDVMLDSTFVDAESLKGYATHPKHLAVADGKVRPYTVLRSCMDYEI